LAYSRGKELLKKQDSVSTVETHNQLEQTISKEDTEVKVKAMVLERVNTEIKDILAYQTNSEQVLLLLAEIKANQEAEMREHAEYTALRLDVLQKLKSKLETV
jgi:hypothetical protein